MSSDPTTAPLTVQKLDENAPHRATHRIVNLRPVEDAFPARARPPARGSQVSSWGRVPRAGAELRAEAYTRVDVILFSVALGLYLITRFVGLLQYPVYFHGDEAIHTVYASELLRDEGVIEQKTFLPSYFRNGPKCNLSLTVYLQTLRTWWLGKSVCAARATSVLLSCIPALWGRLSVGGAFIQPYG